MNTFMRALTSILSLSIISIVYGNTAYALVIDDFNGPPAQLTSASFAGAPQSTSVVPVEALGGSRELMALESAAGAGYSDELRGTVANGYLGVMPSQSSTVLSYDGRADGSASSRNLNGVDITDNWASNGILMALSFANIGMDITIGVLSKREDGSRQYTEVSQSTHVTRPQAFFFSFKDFLAKNPRFNFAYVDAITVTFSGGSAQASTSLEYDILIDGIRTAAVPQPSTFLLVGIGMIGFVVSRKSQKRLC